MTRPRDLAHKARVRRALLVIGAVAALSLPSCNMEDMDGWVYRKAGEICAQRGGVDAMTFVLVWNVRCNDGHMEEVKP